MNAKPRLFLTSVTLADFAGQTCTHVLGPATLVYGPNGTGKTSVLNAVAVTLTGDLPGAQTPASALADLYASLAGPSGTWTVTVRDSYGRAVVRRWTGAQMRVRVDPPPPDAPDTNDAHEAAIRVRYGSAIADADLRRLRSLSPAALRSWVLDLCAGSAGRTPCDLAADVLAELGADPVPRAGAPADLAWIASLVGGALGDDPVQAAAYLLDGVHPKKGDPDAVPVDGLNDRLTAARGAYRDAGKLLKAPPPDGVDVAAILAACEAGAYGAAEHADLAAAEARRDELLRAQGALTARLADARRTAAETRSRLDAELSAAERRARATRDQIERVASGRDLAEANNAVQAAAARVATLEGAAPAADHLPDLEDAVAAARAALAAHPQDPPASSAEIAKLSDHEQIANDASRAAHDALVAARERLRLATEAREELGSGPTCPVCGQPVDGVARNIDASIAEAQAAVAAAESADAESFRRKSDAHFNLRAAEQANLAHAATASRLATALTTAEQRLSDAQAAAATRAATHERDLAAARALLAEREGRPAYIRSRIAAETERLTAELREADQALARARVAVTEAAAPSDVDGSQDARDLAATAAELAALDARLAALRSTVAALDAARTAAAAYDARIADASRARDAAKLRGEALGTLITVVERCRARAVDAQVAPLVEAVREPLRDILGGEFVARYDSRGNFALGFDKVGSVRPGFVSLARLSDGEFAAVAVTLAWAAAGLTSPPLALCLLDGAEAARGEWSAWILQAGAAVSDLVQVVAAHAGPPDVAPPDGWTVIDTSERAGAESEAA